VSVAGASVVDWPTIGKVVLYSLIAGVGVSTAFGLGIRGATRFAERRADHAGAAAAYALVAVVGMTACLAAAGYGIYLMTQK
jgi:hypothetical protein